MMNKNIIENNDKNVTVSPILLKSMQRRQSQENIFNTETNQDNIGRKRSRSTSYIGIFASRRNNPELSMKKSDSIQEPDKITSLSPEAIVEIRSEMRKRHIGTSRNFKSMICNKNEQSNVNCEQSEECEYDEMDAPMLDTDSCSKRQIDDDSSDNTEQTNTSVNSFNVHQRKVYESIQTVLAGTHTRLKHLGSLMEGNGMRIRRSSFYCRCIWFSVLCFSLLVYTSYRTPSQTYAALAPHIIDNRCYTVNSESEELHTQRYFNHSIYYYVRSTRYHLHTQQLIGLTTYHVGVPLCILVFRTHNDQLRTLYNPVLVGNSERDRVRIKETDVVCPDATPVVVERYKQVSVEYDDISDDYLSGRSVRKRPTVQMREVFRGGDAIILQHLIDTLNGYNVCNVNKNK